MVDLTKQRQHVAHLAKSAFPMHQKRAFTSSSGMILPVYQDLLNVGESVYLNSQMVVRTQPLVTAAMADVHFHIDWFFVPLSMIYTLFPSLRYRTNDLISENFISSDGNLINTGLPLFDIDACLYAEGPGVAYSVFIDNGLPSIFGDAACLTFRLADMLGYNPRAALLTHEEGRVDFFNPNVFPWSALAYQCIYQNYYRDDDWEKRVISSYNVDQRHSQPSVADASYDRGIFAMRFHRRYNDYYNVTKSQPYLNAVNLIGDSSSADTLSSFKAAVNNYLADGGNFRTDIFGSDGSAGSLIPSGLGDASSPAFGSLSSVDTSVYLSPTTSSLRTSFAYEKLLRIIGMSKKDYDHQVLAHFGFQVPHDVKHDITHIFGQHGLMHIGEVVSSADTFDGTNGSALGSIGGKGYCIIQEDKKRHKFTAPVDGVLMAVSYCVPEFDYYDVFDKQNSITSINDFFNPEFDKLGAQPLMAYECLPFSNGTNSQRVGWQSRYMQWKLKKNMSSFAFFHNNSANMVNTYSPWILSSRPLSQYYQVGAPAQTLAYHSFLSLPTDINNIMQVGYNGYWSADYKDSPWLIYQTDPFIHRFSANVTKLSTMSPSGEPDLNGI